MNTIWLRHLIRGCAFALFAVVAPLALAQTTTSSDGASLGNISIDQFADMMQAMKVLGASFATIFLDEGAGLARALFMISLAWLLFRMSLDTKDVAVKVEMIRLVAKGMIVFVMLASWTSSSSIPSGLSGYHLPSSSVQDLVVDSFDQLQTPIFNKVGMDKGTMVKAVGNIWATYWKASDQRGNIRDQARAQAAGKSVWAWLSDNVSLSLDAIVDKAITFVVAIIVAALAVGLIGGYLFMIYLGDIMVIVGMTVGPLMVACLPFVYRPVAQLFDKWILFMISAGFFKLVAALVAALTIGTMATIQGMVNAMYAQATTSNASIANQTLFAGGFLASLVLTILYMLFGLILMLYIPKLVDGLMRGMVSPGVQGVQQAADQTASTVTSVGKG